MLLLGIIFGSVVCLSTWDAAVLKHYYFMVSSGVLTTGIRGRYQQNDVRNVPKMRFNQWNLLEQVIYIYIHKTYSPPMADSPGLN